jgi:hypothetical protein
MRGEDESILQYAPAVRGSGSSANFPRIPRRSISRFSRLEKNDEQRRQHVALASAAWQSIGRGDLCESFISEFGESGQASAE